MTPTPTIKQALTLAVVALLVVSAAPGVVFAADDDGANGDQDSADPINVGETVSGEVDSSDDQDWFAFEAERGESIYATATGAPKDGDGDLRFRLRGPDGDRVGNASVLSPSETETIGAIAERGGTYYVLLYQQYGDINAYSFEVETRRTDDFEPNENRENATPLTDGTVSGEITPSADEDWFSFDAQRGQSITVTATGEPKEGDGDLRLYLRDANGDRVNNTILSPGETTTIDGAAERDGTYYVQLYQRFGQTNAYSMEVTVDGEPATSNRCGMPAIRDSYQEPTDPDGDGLCENVNGDLTFDIVDIQALFVNRDDPLVGADNLAKFDFNGDGEFNVIDVQALFVEYTS